MAQIVEPTSAGANAVGGSPFQMAGDFLQTIFKNGAVILIIILIIVAIGVAIFFILKARKEDMLREQEDRTYAQYKAHLRASTLNAKKYRIKKTYSLLNLFVLGLPLFWNEHSLKLTDKDGNLIGYYRGEVPTHKGELIYCAYKKKSWFIFEDLFLMRTLYSYNYENKIPAKDDKGNIVKGKYETIYEKVHFDKFYDFLPREAHPKHYKELQIQCYGLEEDGYYFTPAYMIKDKEGKLIIGDYRPEFRENLEAYAVDEQFKRVLRDGGQAVDSAVRTNPNVATNKHWIEKTEDEVIRDQETPRKKEF